MTEKDLFNAINEIDTKYITDAWQNTEAEPLTIENGKTSKLKIFATAAAFAAAVAAICLVVYIRINYPDVTLPNNNSLSVHSPGDVLPSDIHGPDDVRITYGDVTEVIGEDGKTFAADDITADNWQRIVCDGFTYLAMPFNFVNHRQDPVSPLEPLSYKRWNVGDTFNGLTVKSASTVFQYHYKGDPTFTPNECSVEFDGTASVDGYITYTEDGNLVCVTNFDGESLPILYPCEELKWGIKNKYGDLEYDITHFVFYLDNNNNLDIDSILSKPVTLKVSNISMYSVSSMKMPNYTRATIDDISAYVPEEKPTGDLPFELYGPDNVQIRYEDIGHINYNGTRLSVNSAALTEDNWESIYCYDFGYIAQPTGRNFNSIDHPHLFDSNGNYFGTDDTVDTMNKYERINVGDTFGSLTLREATTAFFSANAPELRFDSCLLQFDGSVNINAYLVRRPETEEVFCVPLFLETSLPILAPFANDSSGTFYSTWWTGRYRDKNIDYYTELPNIMLRIPDGFNLDDYLAVGECKLVNLTLDNITAFCMRRTEYQAAISADITEINDAVR